MMSPVSSSKPSTPVAKANASYAGEASDVRALLEADDRAETVSMSRAAIRNLFKPSKSKQLK